MSVATSMVSLLVPEDLKAEIERRAQENQRTRSGEIRYAVEQYYRMISPDQPSEPVAARAAK